MTKQVVGIVLSVVDVAIFLVVAVFLTHLFIERLEVFIAPARISVSLALGVLGGYLVSRLFIVVVMSVRVYLRKRVEYGE